MALLEWLRANTEVITDPSQIEGLTVIDLTVNEHETEGRSDDE